MFGDFFDDVNELTINDFKRCIAEMKKAHPFMDDERMCVSYANPEHHPYIVVMLEVDGTEVKLNRRVSHKEKKC